MVLSLGVIGTFIQRITSSDYHDWEMPFTPITIIDTTKSFQFGLMWAYSSIAVVVYAGIISCTDLLICGVLAHISTQCKMLQNSLCRMVENAYQNMMDDLGLVSATKQRWK